MNLSSLCISLNEAIRFPSSVLLHLRPRSSSFPMNLSPLVYPPCPTPYIMNSRSDRHHNLDPEVSISLRPLSVIPPPYSISSLSRVGEKRPPHIPSIVLIYLPIFTASHKVPPLPPEPPSLTPSIQCPLNLDLSTPSS